MKFQMLDMGARFEFEGKIYVKNGPLTAMTESGDSRMIPRFALLKPLDVSPAQPRKIGSKLDSAKVMTAFEQFYMECSDLLADDSNTPAVRQAALAAARERFHSGLSE